MPTRYTRVARTRRRRRAFLDRASLEACRSSERVAAILDRAARTISKGAEVGCDRGQSQPTISDAEPGEPPASSGSGWGRTGPSTRFSRMNRRHHGKKIFIGHESGVSERRTVDTPLPCKPNRHRWGATIVAIERVPDNEHFHSARRTVPTHRTRSRRLKARPPGPNLRGCRNVESKRMSEFTQRSAVRLPSTAFAGAPPIDWGKHLH